MPSPLNPNVVQKVVALVSVRPQAVVASVTGVWEMIGST